MQAILNVNGFINNEKILVNNLREHNEMFILILGLVWLRKQNLDIGWQINVLKVMRSDCAVVPIMPTMKATITTKDICF